MATGPGKYDDLCTHVREQAAAHGAIVVIISGKKGSGFSVQADIHSLAIFPEMLEHMAREIRAGYGTN